LVTDDLSAEAKTLLVSLRGRTDFLEILDLLSKTEPPKFKPIREDTLSPEAQNLNWVYTSGVLRENARIINFFLGVSK